MKRNLHYFIFPLNGSIWKWNVEQLRPFLPSFNGKKIVVVAEDGHTDPFSEVEKAFSDPGIEFIRANNDPSLGEVVTFIKVMERLESLDPEEITFYGHAKGVTQWMPLVHNVMAWAWAMYRLNLSDLVFIERVMSIHAAAGAFRYVRPEGPSWIYAGAFFWLKHSEIFSRKWRDIASDRWGVEDYPGRHFRSEETFDVGLGRGFFSNLYENPITVEEVQSILVRQPSSDVKKKGQ